jgi:hypothetical protein
MMRWMTTCAIVLILVAGAPSVWAHDDFRIIGTLMKHENSKIEVKNRAGKTISIRLDKQTAISRDSKKVTPSELRVGQSLVVDAYGDTEDDSLAIEIRIVPPIRAGGV